MQTDLDRRILSRVLGVALLREKRRRKICEAISATYETTPGDPRFCVRRLEVVEQVARALEVTVLNNAFFAEVEAAAQSLGFQAIRNGNRALFRCGKRRDHDSETALAMSRANRRDDRWPSLAHASPP